MKKLAIMTVFILLLTTIDNFGGLKAKTNASCDWPMFGNTPNGSRYSECSKITKNEKIWEFKTERSRFGSTPAIMSNVCYYATEYGLIAIDANTGKKLWDTMLRQSVAPLIYGDYVYYGFTNGEEAYLKCCKRSNGLEEWSFKCDRVENLLKVNINNYFSSANISNGKVYFVFNSILYCVKSSDGTLLWKFDEADTYADQSYCSPVISEDYVFISCAWQTYCLNKKTGSLVWRYKNGGSITIDGSNAYVCSYWGKLECLNAKKGTLLWQNPIQISGKSSVSCFNGRIYIGDVYSKFYCLNSSNGETLWSYIIGNGSDPSSAAITSNGRVYFGCGSGVYCLDSTNGEKIWEYRTDDSSNIISCPSLGANYVIFGSGGGKLYCFGDVGQSNADTCDVSISSFSQSTENIDDKVTISLTTDISVKSVTCSFTKPDGSIGPQNMSFESSGTKWQKKELTFTGDLRKTGTWKLTFKIVCQNGATTTIDKTINLIIAKTPSNKSKELYESKYNTYSKIILNAYTNIKYMPEETLKGFFSQVVKPFVTYFSQQYETVYSLVWEEWGFAQAALFSSKRMFDKGMYDSALEQLNQAIVYYNNFNKIYDLSIDVWKESLRLTSKAVIDVASNSCKAACTFSGPLALQCIYLTKTSTLLLKEAYDTMIFEDGTLDVKLRDYAINVAKEMVLDWVSEELSDGTKEFLKTKMKIVEPVLTENMKIGQEVNEIVKDLVGELINADNFEKEFAYRILLIDPDFPLESIDVLASYIKDNISSMLDKLIKGSNYEKPLHMAISYFAIKEYSTSSNKITIRLSSDCRNDDFAVNVVDVKDNSVVGSATLRKCDKTLDIRASLNKDSIYKLTATKKSNNSFSNKSTSINGDANNSMIGIYETTSSEIGIGKQVTVSNTGKYGLHVRKEANIPDRTDNVIKTLQNGTVLTVIDGPVSNQDFTWWKVKNQAEGINEGWVACGNWLKPQNSDGLRIGSEVRINCKIGLRLRSDASVSSEKLAVLSNNDYGKVIWGPILNDGYVWFYLRTKNDLYGWCATAPWIEPSVTDSTPPKKSKPSPPLNFKAGPFVQDGDDYVLLTWEKPKDPGYPANIQYRLYKGKTRDDRSSFYNLTKYNKMNIKDVELCKKYYYWVTAVNEVGESPDSNVAEYVLDSGNCGGGGGTPDCKDVPGKPSQPDVKVDCQSKGIYITWDEPKTKPGCDVSYYEIYRDDGDKHTIYFTKYYDIRSNLVYGAPYKYKVRAHNKNGDGYWSEWSIEVKFSCEDQNSCNVDITEMKPQRTTSLDAKIELTLNVDAKSVVCMIRDPKTKKDSPDLSFDGNGKNWYMEYTFSDPGQWMLFFEIECVTGGKKIIQKWIGVGGPPPPGGGSGGGAGDDKGLPNKPIKVNATLDCANKGIKIEWEKATVKQGTCEVTESIVESSLGNSITVSGNKAVMQNLEKGKEYKFRVKSKNCNGYGEWSDWSTLLKYNCDSSDPNPSCNAKISQFSQSTKDISKNVIVSLTTDVPVGSVFCSLTKPDGAKGEQNMVFFGGGTDWHNDLRFIGGNKITGTWKLSFKLTCENGSTTTVEKSIILEDSNNKDACDASITSFSQSTRNIDEKVTISLTTDVSVKSVTCSFTRPDGSQGKQLSFDGSGTKWQKKELSFSGEHRKTGTWKLVFTITCDNGVTTTITKTIDLEVITKYCIPTKPGTPIFNLDCKTMKLSIKWSPSSVSSDCETNINYFVWISANDVTGSTYDNGTSTDCTLKRPVKKGERFCVEVTAKNKYGESEHSEMVCYTVSCSSCTTPPDKVTGLNCSYDKSTKKMYTSWNAPNSCCAITKYIIYINSNGGSWVPYEHTSTSRTFTMQGDAKFCVKVKAINCNGEGAFSEECCCGETPPPPKCKPSKPGTPKGQADYSKKKLTFTWTASSVTGGCCAVKTYKWKYTLNGKRYGDEFDTQGNTNCFWEGLSSAAKGTYCVQVKAVDCNGNESDWSELGCFDYNPPEQSGCKPNAPTLYTPQYDCQKKTIKFVWSKPSVPSGCSDVTKYVVSLSINGKTPSVYEKKGTSEEFSDIVNGTSYTFKVKAVTKDGESEYASTTCKIDCSSPNPNAKAPKLVKPANKTILEDSRMPNNLVLEWKKPSNWNDTMEYIVEISKWDNAIGGLKTVFKLTFATSQDDVQIKPYNETNAITNSQKFSLEYGTKYNWHVASRFTSGNTASTWSPMWEFTTPHKNSPNTGIGKNIHTQDRIFSLLSYAVLKNLNSSSSTFLDAGVSESITKAYTIKKALCIHMYINRIVELLRHRNVVVYAKPSNHAWFRDKAPCKLITDKY